MKEKYFKAILFLGDREIGSVAGPNMTEVDLTFGDIHVKLQIDVESNSFSGTVAKNRSEAFNMYSVPINDCYTEELDNAMYSVLVCSLDNTPYAG